MDTVIVRISSTSDMKARFAAAMRGEASTPSIEFASYDDMHRVLAPSRLAVVKVLAGQGALSIREVARRVGRDVQAVHRDVTTLINAGVIDRTSNGIEFPYEALRFEYSVSVLSSRAGHV